MSDVFVVFTQGAQIMQVRNPNLREAKIALLRKAREILSAAHPDTTESRFVCVRLYRARNKLSQCASKVNQNNLYGAYRELTETINISLFPHSNIESWLVRVHEIKLEDKKMELKQYRLDWINFMITQVEKGEI